MNESNLTTTFAGIARLCQRGVLGHAEMWGQLFELLPAVGQKEFLDDLPPDCQAFLRQSIVKESGAFASAATASALPASLTSAVERWCRQPA